MKNGNYNNSKKSLSVLYRKILFLIPMLFLGVFVNGQVSFTLSTNNCYNQVYLNNISNIASPVYYDWDVSGYSSFYEYGTHFNGYGYSVGTYTAILSAYSDVGMINLIDSDTQSFTFAPTIEAGFLHTILSSNCISTEIQLTDTSTNSPNSWNWAWTDENGQYQNSNLQNPIISIWNGGPIIYLSVSNGSCSNNLSYTIPISNATSCDSTYFSIQDLSGCDTIGIKFNNLSIYDSLVFYDWDIPSLVSNTYWEYGRTLRISSDYSQYSPGTYPATLKVYEDAAHTILLDSFTQNFVIPVNNSIQADFSYSVINNYCTYSEIQLTDLSSNSPSSWNWNWTDENGYYQYSNSQDHIITVATGNTTIYLSVYDSLYCYSYTDSTISLSGNSFNVSISDTIISENCDSTTIQFFSSDTASSYDWVFGNGQTSLVQNPIITFQNSDLPSDATLTISNGACPAIDSLYIHGSTLLGCDSIDFTVSVSNLTCDSNSVNFQITTSNISGLYYDWTIPSLSSAGSSFYNYWAGNAFALNYPNGTYTATLNIYSDVSLTNLTQTVSHTFTVNTPVSNLSADFIYTLLNPSCSFSTYQFSDVSVGALSSLSWSHNGSFVSSLQNPIMPLYGGINIIDLNVTDSLGCNSSIEYTIVVPINNFNVSISDTLISQDCDSTTIQFFAIGGSTFNWNVGGQTSTLQNPIFSFVNDGNILNSFLSASNGICTSMAYDSLGLILDTCGIISTNCVFTLTLNDSYGDGWNGNSLNVYNNGSLVNNFTFTNSMNSGNSFDFDININTLDLLTFQFDNSGNWSYECSWELRDSDGNLVHSEDATLSTATVGPITAVCNSFGSDLTANIANYIDCSNYSINFNALPQGGYGPYNFLWTYGANTYTTANPTFTVNSSSTTVSVTITDINGQISYESITIDFLDELTTTATYVNNSSNPCVSDSCEFEITLTANGGIAPYQYSINGGNSFVTGNVFDNLCAGTYPIEIQDALGCSYSTSIFIDSVQGLTLSMVASTPTCDSTDYLYARVYPSNGSGDYSYQWSNGDTTYMLGDYWWSNNITLGAYNVIVTDNVTGCTASATANLFQDCYSVSGTVYVDYNGNCVVDGNDHPFSNSYHVSLVDQSGNSTFGYIEDFLHFSDNGEYEIFDIYQETYYFNFHFSGYNTNGYTQNCVNINTTIDASNPHPVVDLFITPPVPVQDLSISMTSWYGVSPGFYDKVRTRYCNDGTITMDGFVEINFDPQVIYDATSIYAYPTPDAVDVVSHTLTYNFTGLQAGQCRNINTVYNTPVTLPLGVAVTHTAVVEPLSGDVTPSNNLAYYIDTCTGSWDPNDKAVYPQGAMTIHEKDHDYTIRFQNEGTANTTFVIVRDNLDDNLDIESLRNVSASHNFVMTVENDDELVFTFNNCHLTPKDVDEPNSMGSIDFTISQKPNLPLGTIIANTAEIYFDFNEAIITNTTINVIAEKATGIKDVELLEPISIFPNPSTGLFNIETENGNDILSIEVVDVLGKVVFESNDLSGNKALINLQNTSEGVYTIDVKTSNGTSSEKIVITK